MRIWDLLSSEYYSELHRTSRNFDTIIKANLKTLVPKLRPSHLYLDLGGGRGGLEELYNTGKAIIFVGDISVSMMKTERKWPRSNPRIQLDAFHLPFKSDTFDGVFSLVGDPYARRESFEGVLRILRPAGFFVVTIPSRTWRKNLAPFLNSGEDEAIFSTTHGTCVRWPSFTYDEEDLRKILLECSFVKVKSGMWKLDNLIETDRFSAHVILPAGRLGVPPGMLPLLSYAIAYKAHQT
jgi:SAM-dependent methyltransferase